MSTSRNGGLIDLPSFNGGTRTHGIKRQGLARGLGTVLPPPYSRAGGYHALAFASATRNTQPARTPVIRNGGFLGALSFASGTKSLRLGPQVQNQTPTPGTNINPRDTVSFDVVDSVPFLFVEIQVDQAQREIVHDGSSFLYPYLSSTRTTLANGFRYSVTRTKGWTFAPTFYVRAYDTDEQGG